MKADMKADHFQTLKTAPTFAVDHASTHNSIYILYAFQQIRL